jgi:hypothetical protein
MNRISTREAALGVGLLPRRTWSPLRGMDPHQTPRKDATQGRRHTEVLSYMSEEPQRDQHQRTQESVDKVAILLAAAKWITDNKDWIQTRPLIRDPIGGPAINSIKRVVNETDQPVEVWKIDVHWFQPPYQTMQVGPNGRYEGEMWMPWADNQSQFRGQGVSLTSIVQYHGFHMCMCSPQSESWPEWGGSSQKDLPAYMRMCRCPMCFLSSRRYSLRVMGEMVASGFRS